MNRKNIYQRIILFFMFFGVFHYAQATPEKAFYKELSLKGVERFYIKGPMAVDFKYGEEEKVELYIRQKYIHLFNIGTELTDGHETFFIKDTTKSIGEEGKVNPLAHIIFTTKKLNTVTADDVQLLTINDFVGDYLNINAMGFSNVLLKGGSFDLAKIYIRDLALLKVESVAIDDLSLFQLGQSKTAIDGLKGTNLKIDLRDHARVSLKNILTEYLHGFGSFKTHLYAKENSVINTAYLSGNVNVKMDLTEADIKVVNGNFANEAKVKLGEVKMLSVYARNNVKVQYAGKPILNNTLEDNSTITKLEVEKVDLDE